MKKKRYKTLKINQTEISELVNTMNELNTNALTEDQIKNQKFSEDIHTTDTYIDWILTTKQL